MLAYCWSPILPGALLRCSSTTNAAMDEGIDSCLIGVKGKICKFVFYPSSSRRVSHFDPSSSPSRRANNRVSVLSERGLHNFKCVVAGACHLSTDLVRQDDAAVTGGVIHGCVVAVNHESCAAKRDGVSHGKEMGYDWAFASGVVEERLDRVAAAR